MADDRLNRAPFKPELRLERLMGAYGASWRAESRLRTWSTTAVRVWDATNSLEFGHERGLARGCAMADQLPKVGRVFDGLRFGMDACRERGGRNTPQVTVGELSPTHITAHVQAGFGVFSACETSPAPSALGEVRVFMWVQINMAAGRLTGGRTPSCSGLARGHPRGRAREHRGPIQSGSSTALLAQAGPSRQTRIRSCSRT